MGYVYFNLARSSALTAMVPPSLGAGMFGVAALPAGLAGPGMYVIINTNGAVMSHNRYVGISRNLARRFGGRMGVITEMGFDAATLAQIHVVWGRVKIRNHAVPLGTPMRATTNVIGGGMTNIPQWNAGGWTVANPVGGPLTGIVDGNVLNLEHMLIRFIFMHLGAGGTVSNNLLMGAFNHPQPGGAMGALPIHVKFRSAAFGAYPSFARVRTIDPGFQM